VLDSRLWETLEVRKGIGSTEVSGLDGKTAMFFRH
jgi:hypothetical protein